MLELDKICYHSEDLSFMTSPQSCVVPFVHLTSTKVAGGREAARSFLLDLLQVRTHLLWVVAPWTHCPLGEEREQLVTQVGFFFGFFSPIQTDDKQRQR